MKGKQDQVTANVMNLRREKVKAAVVGLGKMGLVHAGILNALPNVQLRTLCDKSSLICRFSRKVFRGLRIVGNVEQLRHSDLDAIYITTPIPSHSRLVKSIYESDVACNLFVEKTLTSNYQEAAELCRLAKSSKGVNMVGYMKRFNATFNRGKQLLDQGVLGEVASFDAYAYSSDFCGDKASPKTSMSRGGVLRDLGAHVIDLALWFFGELEVDSVELESASGATCENSALFRTKGEDGLEGKFGISWCEEDYRLPEFGLVIRGSKGTMSVDDDKVELNNGKVSRWYRHDLHDDVDFLLGAPEYFREDRYFIDAILSGSKAEPSFSTASKVDFVIDQVIKVGRLEGIKHDFVGRR